MTTRSQQFETVQKECLELFQRKNKDYGDAFADYGVVGVLVRMGDKIRRLQNISNTGVTLVKDESFRDTLIDLHNYAAMAVLLLDSNDKMSITTDDDSEYESEDDCTIVNENGSKELHVWMVSSSCNSDITYEVVKYEDDSMSCDCKGFEHHGWCKHCEAKKDVVINIPELIAPYEEENKIISEIEALPDLLQNNTRKWFVESSSDPNTQYEVTKYPNGEMTCTCKGFEHHKWCKHCEQYKN